MVCTETYFNHEKILSDASIAAHSLHLNAYFLYLIDYNECDFGVSNCSQKCINTDGSFRCECDEGYELNPDGKSCRGNLQLTLLVDKIILCLTALELMKNFL